MQKPQSSNLLDFLMVGYWTYMMTCSVDFPKNLEYF